jgi:hypothetical protein
LDLVVGFVTILDDMFDGIQDLLPIKISARPVEVHMEWDKYVDDFVDDLGQGRYGAR